MRTRWLRVRPASMRTNQTAYHKAENPGHGVLDYIDYVSFVFRSFFGVVC